MTEHTVRTICDICGAEIERQNPAVTGSDVSRARWRIPVVRRDVGDDGIVTGSSFEWFDVDLCNSCLNAVTVVEYERVMADDGVRRGGFRWRIGRSA